MQYQVYSKLCIAELLPHFYILWHPLIMEKILHEVITSYLLKVTWQQLCNSSSTTENICFGKVWKTLGGGSAEYDTRQKKLGELYIDNDFFVEYFLSHTQQRLCQVSSGTRQRKIIVIAPGNGDGTYAKCPQSDTRQRLTLCPVSIILTLSKEASRRQRLTICRVSTVLTLNKEAPRWQRLTFCRVSTVLTLNKEAPRWQRLTLWRVSTVLISYVESMTKKWDCFDKVATHYVQKPKFSIDRFVTIE
jgi:hypothetical protein